MTHDEFNKTQGGGPDPHIILLAGVIAVVIISGLYDMWSRYGLY